MYHGYNFECTKDIPILVCRRYIVHFMNKIDHVMMGLNFAMNRLIFWKKNYLEFRQNLNLLDTVHPKKYALCSGLVVINFTHILQGYLTGTGAII